MTYFISDIHGEYNLLNELLRLIGFSQNDELIVVGDMIEKGEDSVAVVQFIRKLKNAKCIIGNHEYAFLKRYWALLRESPNNFDLVLKKLQKTFNDGYKLTWDDIDWMESLPYFIETDEYIAVHAGVPLDGDGRIEALIDAKPEFLLYDRNFKNNTYIAKDQKPVFFGHTPVRYLTGTDEIRVVTKTAKPPKRFNEIQKIHLDTGAYLSGVLGCYCLEENLCYYVQKDA